MVRLVEILRVIIVLLAIMHAVDLVKRVISLIGGTIVTISPHNIVYSSSPAILVVESIILLALIGCLWRMFPSGGRAVNTYLMLTGVYFTVVVVDNVVRTRVGEFLNLGQSLLIGSPVLIGASILYFVVRRLGKQAILESETGLKAQTRDRS